MDPRPPIGFSNGKSYPSEPPGKPNPVNLHSHFPHQISFSHPSYAISAPHQQFPQQHLYPQNVQYVVVQPQYAPFSLPQLPPQPAGTMSMPPPVSAGTMPLPLSAGTMPLPALPQLPLQPAGTMSMPPPVSAGTMPLPALPLQPPIPGAVPFMSVSYSGTPHSVTGPDLQDTVSVDNEENAQPDRTSKRLRLNWTEVEDLRLINAWLDSFKLNSSRKNGVHWGNVTKLYNSSTPKDRRRTRNQLKLRWHKITMKMAHFNDCWCHIEKKYSSVQSDKMQLMDKTWVKYDEEARAMYLEEAKHHFTLGHLWKAVWDQPNWKNYIASLYSKGTKLSESRDCTSSSEDANDLSEKEMDEKDSMSAKKKWEGKSKMSSPSLELEQGIQSSVDPQNVLEKNNLVADTSRLYEFQHEKEKLMARTSSLNEFHHGNSVREDVPEKGRHPQDCNGLEHAMMVRCAPEKDVPEKGRHPQDCNGLEHAMMVRCAPEKETHPQSSKMEKAKRKRKGNISYPSSEVQEDIKRAVDLQRMLQKDREKMSEVQIHLSKEKLEMARLKHQEAKEKKEATLYEKYTELLMADTQRFNDFQKEEHQKAVKCMGVMLFGKDAK